MFSAYDPALRPLRRQPLPRRTIALLVVLAIHALLVAILLLLTPKPPSRPPSDPKVFVLVPTPAPAPAPKPKAAPPATPVTRKKASPAAAAAAPPSPKIPPPPQPKLFEKQLFDAIDIAKLPNQRAAAGPGEAAETDTATADSQSTYGPGEGPGGERLYNAEWQREPTNAELSFYLPRGTPQGSWAVIACRTIERFRVEDCRELGESPPGSRLARGVVEAAWQFRVLPPRIGGRPLVGAWVRIRIDFNQPE